MPLPRISHLLKAAIIGVLLLALAGCNAIRLGYNNGESLAWFWLDAYLDFSSEQTPAAKQGIARWLAWHRATQLGDYATLLASLQPAVGEPATPAQACVWQDRLRDALDPAIDRALIEFADLLPGLGEAQFKHLAQRYAKGDAEMRDDFLQADPAERLKQAVRRTVERSEQLYGALQDAQLRVIAAGVEASPFNPERWLAERQRRQADTVRTLRRLVAERADRDTRLTALRALAAQSKRSPDAEYRAYQQRLADYNCAFAARIHNATTAAQRASARETLKAWEDDLRSLIEPR